MAYPAFDLNKKKMLKNDIVYNDIFMSRKKFKNECICFDKFYVSLYHFLKKKYYIWWFKDIFQGIFQVSEVVGADVVGVEVSFMRDKSVFCEGPKCVSRGGEVSFRKKGAERT